MFFVGSKFQYEMMSGGVMKKYIYMSGGGVYSILEPKLSPQGVWVSKINVKMLSGDVEY